DPPACLGAEARRGRSRRARGPHGARRARGVAHAGLARLDRLLRRSLRVRAGACARCRPDRRRRCLLDRVPRRTERRLLASQRSAACNGGGCVGAVAMIVVVATVAGSFAVDLETDEVGPWEGVLTAPAEPEPN